jgi:hypothetical protein
MSASMSEIAISTKYYFLYEFTDERKQGNWSKKLALRSDEFEEMFTIGSTTMTNSLLLM